jgi:hypothetical protein
MYPAHRFAITVGTVGKLVVDFGIVAVQLLSLKAEILAF